jgi:uncharacterized protein (TIGR02647 family)
LAGLKIHHEADPARIAAAKRLFAKNVITLEDGGYLTPLGLELADQTQKLIRTLESL